MHTLNRGRGGANMAPHIAVGLTGQPYQGAEVDPGRGDQWRPDTLVLNSHARVPTLADGETVSYEAAANLLHLIDRHPEQGLAPDLGTPERGVLCHWLMPALR